MADLKSALEAMNFQNIKTVLASGNVLFNAPKYTVVALGRAIEAKVKERLGHEVGVIVRTFEEVRTFVDEKPFKRVKMTAETKLYVTFLPERPETSFKTPWVTPEKDFRVIRATESVVCSVLAVSRDRQSTDAMRVLEKQFGKQITTRNWNTIEKIVAADGA